MRERAVIAACKHRRALAPPSRPLLIKMRALARASARVAASRVARTTPRDRTRVTMASAASTSASPPRYVDTHCHLDQVLRKMDLESVDDYLTLAETFDGARATLDACVTIGCSSSSFDSTASVVRRSEKMFGAYGVHPLSASEWADAATRDRVRELLTTEPRVVAVGETGLDYHRLPEAGETEAEYKAAQREAFVAQMALARELDLPLIVHTREAEEDTLELMKAHLPRDARVHVHCFTSSAALAKALLEAFPSNLCLGFTGVATFKNGADVREVIAQVPLEKILLETDAPYMAPTPFRGQTAHPAMVPRIATAIATVHGVDESVVFTTCRDNTRRVYGI